MEIEGSSPEILHDIARCHLGDILNERPPHPDEWDTMKSHVTFAPKS